MPSDLGEWELSRLPSSGSRGHLVGAIVACRPRGGRGVRRGESGVVCRAAAVMRLAEQVDLAGLVASRVRPDLSTGSNPGGKAAAVVAGMATGADSIDDLDVLRHGGMGRLFAAVYAR